MKIAFGYIYGRQERLQNEDYPEEMFYGYHYYLEKYGSVEIIEYGVVKFKILKLIERLIIKVTKLPIHLFHMTSLKNLSLIMKLDYLVLTNDRLLFSLLPLLYIRKLFRRELNLTVFAMNMFKPEDLNSKNYIKILIFRSAYRLVSNFIFLGEGESKIAKQFYQSDEKINFIPFYVDESFWVNKFNPKRDGILFVGNDSNREFDKVIELANYFKDIKFTVVSKHLKISDFTGDNVTFIKGSWGNQKISDSELREIYCKSKLVIIPLVESYQPSGQSVTLQAMALKTPVLISSTKGFWDKENFKDSENIFFNFENTLESWKNKINELYSDEKLLSIVGNNSLQTIYKSYTKNYFEKKLAKIIGL